MMQNELAHHKHDWYDVCVSANGRESEMQETTCMASNMIKSQK